MKVRLVACLPLICGLSLGHALCDQPQTAAKPAPQQVPKGRAWDGSESVEIECQIWQVRGDLQRALKDAGFRQAGGLLQIGGGRDGDTSGPANSFDRLLKRIGEATGVVGPKMTTQLGRKTGVMMGLGSTGQVPFLVRTGEKTFSLEYLAESANLGFTMDLTPRAISDDPAKISISPLQITFTTVDGREPIHGVDLEIGKPIIATRTLKTSITLVDGGDAVGIVLPGPEGRQPILLIAARRVQEPPDPAPPPVRR